MKCECGGNEQKKKVSREISLGGQNIFVQDVDAFVCDKCGETYFDAESLLLLEEQILKQEPVAA